MGFPSIAVLSWPASLALLLVAAATDLMDRRIPNEVAIAVAAIGLAQGLLVRPGSVWLSLVVASVLFCGLAVLSHHRIIGGGDVKLLSAVTLLVPPGQVGRLLIDIALAGGVFASFYLAARFRLKMLPTPAVFPHSQNASGLAVALATERRRIAAGGPMPYALAIFGGVCLYAASESVSCSSALSCLS
jgi:prepilin peptidase CpaA